MDVATMCEGTAHAEGQLMLSALKTVTERYWHFIYDRTTDGYAPCAKACSAEHDAIMKNLVHADFKRWRTTPNQSLAHIQYRKLPTQQLAEYAAKCLKANGWEITKDVQGTSVTWEFDAKVSPTTGMCNPNRRWTRLEFNATNK